MIEEIKAINRLEAWCEWAESLPPVKINRIQIQRASDIRSILAVVDAAKEFQSLTHWGMSDSEAELSDKLNKALAQLEK